MPRSELSNANYSPIIGGKIVASVASNNLSIAVKTTAGNTPSPTEPVYIAFRDANLASGDYGALIVTSALSLSISAGVNSRFGADVALGAFRFWISVFNDGGTLRLALKNCLDRSALIIYPLPQVGIDSALLIDPAVYTNSGSMYASQAITSKPFRIIGFLDWSSGVTTPGYYDFAPDIIGVFTVGVQSPGNAVQRYSSPTAGVNSSTAIIPFDLTPPQNTEGVQFLSATLSPQSPCNLVEIDALINVSHSVASEITAALFLDSEADAILSGYGQVSAANAITQIRIGGMLPRSAVSSYNVRVGPALAGTMATNGPPTPSANLGGTLRSFLSVSEIVC